jgi:methylglutaconyl-CoA hydratase
MSEELVHLEISGGVATIALDSPHNRNALSRQLFGDLERHLTTALGDSRARVLMITGAGPVFCSGADLREQHEANETRSQATGPGGLAGVLKTLWQSPKPVVGRINGAARAGGVGLVAACDIAVAVETATFAFSEVRIGVAPAIISVVTLPKLGISKGMELFLTGDIFDAQEAMRLGLINAAVAADGLDEGVGRFVDSLLKGGPNALAACKRLVRLVPAMAMDEAFAMTAELSARLFASDEALEGMTAFAEKRQPKWLVGG